MSWSVYAVGTPASVAKTLDSQFGGTKCAEPEETIRQSAFATIKAAVAGQRADSVIRVAASGSMMTSYDQESKTWGEPLTNNLSIAIENVCILEKESA